MASTQRTVHLLRSIKDMERASWDRCANPPGAVFDPFPCYDFLHALEASGSTTARTGWQPMHLALFEGEQVIGCAPLYLKGHSQGEYVFDHAWANAWHRAGGSYYPKLQSSIPFTPATGRRLLCAQQDEVTEQLLLEACAEVAQQMDVSSLHITFMPRRQWLAAGKQGYLRRLDQQFHWNNASYGAFDDFLADLSSKKRKNLKRERRQALSAGVTIEWVTGTDLKEHHWDAFYGFYLDTGSRKWGAPYLTRSFFSLINETMAEHILLVMCKREGRYIAGALNFIGGETLYGRNWGCIEDHRFLHFEVCYYQAIDFAIANGLKRVEAGAQGPHKVARGYLPQETYSAHWIRDASFRRAVAHFLDEERGQVSQDIRWIEQRSPFKSDLELGEIGDAYHKSGRRRDK